MKLYIPVCACLLVAACSGPQASAARAAASTNPFTIDDLIAIKHPSAPVWSPDGKRVVFVWDRAGVSNLYVSELSGAEPRALTSEAGAGVTSVPFWSGDSKRIYFAHRGDLWQVPADGGAAAPVWTTPAVESEITRGPDATRVAFTRRADQGTELVVRALDAGTETVIARDEQSIGGVSWSPDGRRIAYAAGARSIRHEQVPDYSGAKIIYTVTERVPGRAFVASTSGGRVVAVQEAAGGGLRWLGNDRLVFDRQSPDFKRRTTFVADASTGAARQLREDVDAKFWSIPGNTGAAAQPSPDGKWIAFLSDRDGWDHLYVMAAGGGEPVQVTKGEFEAWRPVWSPDSTRIAFDANLPGKPGTRHLGIATIDGDTQPKATVAMITDAGAAPISRPSGRPTATRLVYQHTDPQTSADLFVDRCGWRRLVAAFRLVACSCRRGDARRARVRHYPGPDGQQVPGWLFVPKNLDRSKKHPAIVWIHGDGVNQNYDGWHVQRNYAVYYCSTNTCCSKAMSSSRRTIAAASATAATGGRASTWTSAARTRRTRGWRPTT